MAARAMWKAVLRLGDDKPEHAVAVKLYAGVQSRRVAFHLLHEADGVRITQRIVNPSTNEEVPMAEVRKGFPIESGFVLVDKEELDALRPKPSRDIEVDSFIDLSALDSSWFERPYYLGPDGAGSSYFALAEALRQTRRQGIARWVMRGTRYAGALREHDGHLVLIALRHREERLELPELKAPHARDADAKELALARQLVGMLEGEFEPGEFRSEYHERVLELIEKKARGEPMKLTRATRKETKITSLESVLKASVAKAGHAGRPARQLTKPLARTRAHTKEQHAPKQKKSA